MNFLYIMSIVIALIMVILFFAANHGGKGLDKEATKGFTVLITICMIGIIVLISLGDHQEYQKQLDAQAARYETNIINGTFKVGLNKTFSIVNEDTIILSNKPFVILLEN